MKNLMSGKVRERNVIRWFFSLFCKAGQRYIVAAPGQGDLCNEVGRIRVEEIEWIGVRFTE